MKKEGMDFSEIAEVYMSGFGGWKGNGEML